MGTSAGYSAPSTPQWRSLKGQVTRVAGRSSITPAQARSLVQGFISANGGAREYARGGGVAGEGRSAQRVGRALGGFLADVRDHGFTEALRRHGLAELIGQPVGEVLTSLLDYLGGSASTLNDADAREALSTVVDEMAEGAATYDELDEMWRATAVDERLGAILLRFYSLYLYEQFCRVFYERLVQRRGADKADSLLEEVKDYISEAAKHETSDRDLAQVDWGGAEGAAMARKILQEAFEIHM